MNAQMIDSLVAYITTLQLTPAQAKQEAAQKDLDGLKKSAGGRAGAAEPG